MKPIRLSKVVSELNVGMQTIVDFLTKQQKPVENNPNFKVSWENYLLLAKEFNPDVFKKLNEERAAAKQQKSEEAKSKDSVSSQKDTEDKAIKGKLNLPHSELKVLGRIDLNAKSGKKKDKGKSQPKVDKVEESLQTKPNQQKEPSPKKEESSPEEQRKQEVKEIPQSPIVESEKKEENQSVQQIPNHEAKEEKQPLSPIEETAKEEQPNSLENKKDEKPLRPVLDVSFEEALPELPEEEKEKDREIFRFRTPTIKSKIKVVDHIDLNSINQLSRPKPKTREEKRREQREKERERRNAAQKRQVEATKQTNDQEGEDLGEEENGKRVRNRFQRGKVDLDDSRKSSPKGRKEDKGDDRKRDKRENNEENGGKKRNKSKDKSEQRRERRNSLRVEINEEDIQKQVKETLQRLTNKPAKQKGVKYRKEKREVFAQRQQEQMEAESGDKKVLKITEFVTVNDLAMMMNVPVNKVIGTCMSVGLMVSINMRLDAEAINLVAEEFGFKTEYVSADVANAIEEEEEVSDEENLLPRPPIVTIMGHVDHGKTSLLDHIRNTNVIAGEAGGITQHIGAYHVQLQSGKTITFLDTPGHEAFTAMRARGAKITDIAVIIVAADDDVMPQTIEAINHASAAGVPIVFAINKVDKPAANPDKIKETLANMNYLVEEWGGKYQSQDISAKKGTGVRELLDKILLEAEMLDLKADPSRKAVGSVIESSLDKGRGYVATVLVQSGTLKMGDYILAGTHFGRVKAMFNERNQRLEEAGPSEPVLILGLNGAPQAGDKLNVMETEQEVRSIATKREQLQREQGLRTQKHLTLEDLGRRIAIGNFQELNIIVKGDVDGSVEALSDSLIKLSTKEIQVNVIHKAVGQISETDVTLAAASNAVIVGFQVRPSSDARKLAEQEQVDIRLYSVIYKAIEEITAAMEGMLAPEVKEEVTSTTEVKETFKISKVGTIAGCIVKEGKIKNKSKVRLIRDGIVVYTGVLGSLKRFKDDAKEVQSGMECGLSIENFNDIKVGDVIESYEEVEVKKTL